MREIKKIVSLIIEMMIYLPLIKSLSYNNDISRSSISLSKSFSSQAVSPSQSHLFC